MPPPHALGPRSSVLAALYATFGAISIAGFYDTGNLYGDFGIPQLGVQGVDARELTFYLWYALWGSLGVGFFALAAMRTRLPERALDLVARMLARPWHAVGVSALAVLATALFLRSSLFLDQPIADDESTYAFIAQTLVHGRVVNPVPAESEFYSNQFVIINERGWFGRYPIGHPLLLALGEAVGARVLVVPILGLCTVLLTFVVGRRLIGPRLAALAACLLLFSPQFVLTHATQLSQPASTVWMLLSMWAVLRLHEDRRLRWAAATGAFAGFGLLVRPMPGALLLPALLAGHLALRFSQPSEQTGTALWKELMAAVPGVVASCCVMAWVHYAQAGDPLMSGYGAVGSGAGALSRTAGHISNSIGGAFVRQNFWLLGWPLSFAFLPFSRLQRGRWLFWAMLAAIYGYRLLVPKTVVATTGPVYVFEAIPLLLLATVDGAHRAAALLGRLQVSRPRAWLVALAVAASLVALLAFVPNQMRSIATSSAMRVRVHRLLGVAGAERSLVFADALVNPERGVTWAYYAPNPAPSLDDATIFVRQPVGVGGPAMAYRFWHSHYADRRAFIYLDDLKRPAFKELSATDPPAPAISLEAFMQSGSTL